MLKKIALDTKGFLLSVFFSFSVLAMDENAIMKAIIENNQPEVVKLVQSLDLTIKQSVLNKALLHAVRNGKLDIVNYLLKQRANANFEDAVSGGNSLYWAVSKADLPTVKTLLRVPGINVNSQDVLDQKTPLHRAIQLKNNDLVRLLLENNASLDIKNFSGQTPLDFANAVNNKDAILLIQQRLKSIAENQARQQTQANLEKILQAEKIKEEQQAAQARQQRLAQELARQKARLVQEYGNQQAKIAIEQTRQQSQANLEKSLQAGKTKEEQQEEQARQQRLAHEQARQQKESELQKMSLNQQMEMMLEQARKRKAEQELQRKAEQEKLAQEQARQRVEEQNRQERLQAEAQLQKMSLEQQMQIMLEQSRKRKAEQESQKKAGQQKDAPRKRVSAKRQKTKAPIQTIQVSPIITKERISKEVLTALGLPETGQITSSKILGIPANASRSEVKNAYSKLILQWHPDKAEQEGKDINLAKEVTQALNSAYKTMTQIINRREARAKRTSTTRMSTSTYPHEKRV